ncbi:MAG: exodeoxyribonuclease V subunit gamma [Bacteroidota bacterium]
MSYQLYISNSLEQLAQQLGNSLSNESPGVFQQQHIITQTEGMNKWLTGQIATQLGISAQVAFHSPNDIIGLLHEWLSEKPFPVITSDKIRWQIWKELNQPGFQQAFPDISAYYQQDPIRQIALADQLADLFDQYQIYRHGIINSWNDPSTPLNGFQQYLWKKLQSYYQERVLDKSSIVTKLKKALENPSQQTLLRQRVQGLHFFGIAVITPLHLELFRALATHIPLHFYLMNPAPLYYWLEDETEKVQIKKRQKNKLNVPAGDFNRPGNTLLLGWGAVIKDSFALLFQQEELINELYDDLVTAPEDPRTLLQKVQSDIFINAWGDDRHAIEDADLRDKSIIINSCYTPAREVEVLYNELVQLVEARPGELAPRDILVLCTNIDKYAPYIRAVFDNAPYVFPYAISDEKISQGQNLFGQVQRLLQLNEESMIAEEILDLLESKFIRNRFGISDTALIRETILTANIRRDISGQRQNDTRLVSWEYGLQRIAYGWCISGSPFFSTPQGDTIIPLDTIEGDEIFELVRFQTLVNELINHLRERQRPRPVGEWVNYVRALISDLFSIDEEEDGDDYHELITHLDHYATFAEDVTDPVSYEVFNHHFLKALESVTRQQNFGRGGALFCSLIPMRSIPHKVVAMLGMNYDEFPRKDSRPDFDLQKQQPAKGDRNIRNNDKHLLLETLLSAREHLIISYLGQDVKQNQSIPPSALVDELINYIVEGIPGADYKKRKEVITVHPLHGFSGRYGNGGPDQLVSYLQPPQTWTPAKKTPLASTPPEQNIIELYNLCKFIKSPFTWYLQKKWQLYLYQEEILLEDSEMFELENFSQKNLLHEILQRPPSEYDALYREMLLTGKLPLSNRGRIIFNGIAADAKVLYEEMDGIRLGQPIGQIPVNLQLSSVTIQGVVEVYGDKLIERQEHSKLKKELFPAFTRYCCLRAQNLPISFHFRKKGKLVTVDAGQLSPQQAMSWLEFVAKGMIEGTEKPFLLFPEWKNAKSDYYFENGRDGVLDAMATDLYKNKDQYLTKAIEWGYFGPAYFDELKANADFAWGFLNNIDKNLTKEN